MSARGEVTIAEAEVDAASPYHIVLDTELRVLGVGRVIRRLLPELAHGEPLAEHFGVLSVSEKLSYDALSTDPERLRVLRSKRLRDLVLRGQFLLTREGLLLFLGYPRLTAESAARLGLSFSDFAARDPVPGCLLHEPGEFSSLTEATRFSFEVAQANAELEHRVAERTTELKRTADDLARALSRLESANRSLEHEKAERERVEAELRLAHRLDAVGQLAAGIAHEINTPIQYVGDSVAFIASAFDDLVPLLRELPTVMKSLEARGDELTAKRLEKLWEDGTADYLLEQVPRALARTFDGVERVASIVSAMKAFAHPGSEERSPADLNQALTNTLAVSRNEYKYVADIETDFGSLPPVLCKIGELNQVFLNLVVNAAHAIGDVFARTDQRGKIRLSTRLEGEEVVIHIEDTGGGIPEAVRHKIFDPFFTTKPVGKGTGQGLTIARSIVVKAGGSLSFSTEENRGTTFTIRLPVGEEYAACAQ